MKLIEVNQATPTQLDWLVATMFKMKNLHLCYGSIYKFYNDNFSDEVPFDVETTCNPNQHGTLIAFSTRWEQGGPLIESENIDIEHYTPHAEPKYCIARTVHPYNARGETALIAAMRCLIKTQMGGFVEVPDEL